jgi:hypothetical protein
MLSFTLGSESAPLVELTKRLHGNVGGIENLGARVDAVPRDGESQVCEGAAWLTFDKEKSQSTAWAICFRIFW